MAIRPEQRIRHAQQKPVRPRPDRRRVAVHPGRLSLSATLAQAFHDGALSAGHEVRTATRSDMAFNPDFGQASFRDAPALDPDLGTFRANLVWAEDVVLVSPMWWGGLPAKAKGHFDRALLPGFAFAPRTRRLGPPTPLLAGRTAHFMLTSDTPTWAFWLMYGRALKRQVQRQILSYVGLKPARHTHFRPSSTALRKSAPAGCRTSAC